MTGYSTHGVRQAAGKGIRKAKRTGLLLDCVLSVPYVDAAPVGMHEPRFVDPNKKIPDDVASRIDLAKLYER